MTPRRTGRSGPSMRRPESAGMDETSETHYASALRQTTMDQQHAMGEALAQAESFLGELADLGRYAPDVKPEDRESDRLRLALALLRARRGGFEDGAALLAWWRDSVNGSRRGRPGG